MFCPRCKAEYRPGFYRCSDCNIALVYQLPAEPADLIDSPNDSLNNGPADFVVLTTARDPFEEGQICSFLRANGIPAEPAPDTAGRSYPGLGTRFVEILVPRELADAAAELLDRANRGEFRIDASDK